MKQRISGKYHSYIVKHAINYNLSNTGQNSVNCSKILLTDYDIARKLNSQNYSLYNGLDLVEAFTQINDTLNINYHNINYNIYITTGNTTYTNNTSGITNSSGLTIVYIYDLTININDYINITITDLANTYTYLNLNTFIKDIHGNYITLQDHIPNNILTGCLTGFNYTIETLQYVDDFIYGLNKSYMNKYYNVISKSKSLCNSACFDNTKTI